MGGNLQITQATRIAMGLQELALMQLQFKQAPAEHGRKKAEEQDDQAQAPGVAEAGWNVHWATLSGRFTGLSVDLGR